MSSVDCCGVAALARDGRDVDTLEPDVLRIARVLEDKTKINIQHLALQKGIIINVTKIIKVFVFDYLVLKLDRICGSERALPVGLTAKGNSMIGDGP